MSELNRTIIIRHKRENLKKCSLRGLESKENINFFTYPILETLPCLSSYLILTLDAEPLTRADRKFGLLIVDGTWRYAEKMEKCLNLHAHPLRRSLPSVYRTAYPRKQTGCSSPERGLSSIEALAVAHFVLGKNVKGLLDNYHWKKEFLIKNAEHLDLSLF